MRLHHAFVLLGIIASASVGCLFAQEQVAPGSTTAELIPSEQLEQIVSPIALYPDPLVALILPASTFPSDIVLAARFLAAGGTPESASAESWDESVRSLTRYREVIDYLDQNLAWTRRLGGAFLDQPDAVMGAIQAVRARARAMGVLTSTAQQDVLVEREEIWIVPATPTVIYVPRYDPTIFWATSWPVYSFPRVWLTFGIGYQVGPWLSYDCDWRARYVRVTDRPRTWYFQPDWRYRHSDPATITSIRWSSGPRHDRRFERRDFVEPRHPIAAAPRTWTRTSEPQWNRPSERDISRSERPRESTREVRVAREEPVMPARRHTQPVTQIATAPSVVAIAPSAPTAPVVVTRPPANSANATDSAPPRNGRWNNPRPDSPSREQPREPAVTPSSTPPAPRVIAPETPSRGRNENPGNDQPRRTRPDRGDRDDRQSLN